MQGHQAHSTLHKIACNFDNTYSVKQWQALGILPQNRWNFEKYQPQRYHYWQDPGLQEACSDTFFPVFTNEKILNPSQQHNNAN